MKKASYEALASFYDTLTGNVDYDAVHGFYRDIFRQYRHTPHILLDLACGTGTLSFLFERDGAEVIGTDCSESMLAVATDKRFRQSSSVLFLHQAAHELDLYGTVDTVVCNLDAVNHFLPEQIGEVFRRVALFLEPNGLFVFDVNSLYKFERFLSDSCYSFDAENVFCCWNSTFDGKKANITLDLFSEENKLYARQTETVTEYFYSDELLRSLLTKNNMELLAVFSDYTLNEPTKQSERIHYLARKRD